MKKEVNIYRSETWMDDNFNEIQHILHETIDDFVEKGERIISIEAKERNGLNRFWIYTEKHATPKPKKITKSVVKSATLLILERY